MEELAKLKGNGGTVVVYADRVTIKRSSFSALGNVGDRTFPYNTLGSVVFRKPRWFTDGYIQFIAPGNTSDNLDNLNLYDYKDFFKLVKNPNVVVLSGRGKEWEEVYGLILKKMQEYRAQNTGGQAVISSAGELEKFAALRDKGVITNEEFEAKKKQILSQ